MVKKKMDSSGKQKWRLVMDFRKLNEYTVQDNYPLPSIKEILCMLGTAKFMSCFDMANGFYQVVMAKEDIEKTAFSTHKGHWEWLRMPTGLINAPATYQRMVNFKLQGLLGKICFIYLDDLIVIGKTEEEHLRNLRKVFERLRETRLVLQPDKCKYLEKELEYLGHSVGAEGVKPLKKNVDKVLEFPRPRNAKEIERFVGLASYYRKFIKNFAKIAHPLNHLKGKNVDFIWTQACEEAFNKLKNLLTSCPILKHLDLKKPFILCTDASNEGLGVVLSQLDDEGKEHPVSFASRSLNPAERNYSTTEKEMLAIVWGIKQYKHLLYGQAFKVYTDHQPIKGLLNARHDNMSRAFPVKNKEDIQIRTDHPDHEDIQELLKTVDTTKKRDEIHETSKVAAENKIKPLVETSMDIEEIIRHNEVAPELLEEIIQDLESLNATKHDYPSTSNEKKDAVCEKALLSLKNSRVILSEMSDEEVQKRIGKNHDYITDDLDRLKQMCGTDTITLTQNDETFQNRLYNYKTPPAYIQKTTKPDLQINGAIYRNFDDILKLSKKIWEDERTENPRIIEITHWTIEEDYNLAASFIYPTLRLLDLEQHYRIKAMYPRIIRKPQMQQNIIARVHENGHWALDKTVRQIQQKRYWPEMNRQVQSYIENCPICANKHNGRKIRADAVIMETAKFPCEIVNIDKLTYDGKSFLLLEDSLTRYIWVTPLKTEEVYNAMHQFLHANPTPEKIITDNEQTFKSKKLKELIDQLGIQQIKISAYHPESNGIAERVIKTLKGLADALDHEDPVVRNLRAVKNYNQSPHNTTTYTPEELLYTISKRTTETQEEIDERRKERNLSQLQDAREKIAQAKEVNQKKKQRTGKEEDYQIGDLVLIQVNVKGKASWSEPLAIRNVNRDTKTITTFRRGQEQLRHYNQIHLADGVYDIRTLDDPIINEELFTARIYHETWGTIYFINITEIKEDIQQLANYTREIKHICNKHSGCKMQKIINTMIDRTGKLIAR
ncbi:uncharacterized protein LOC117181328 [Belonocnema kinseyi]|uniref:uncharacterized protein LOC117181328 n=1 Tax=Belonocnema kinseyi TaxID=2817044 RepID=UPI00143DE50B|nr:uncharacterized protein LOC117181328 [Belonocnema kinseyi]